jgi:hypothetical protein
MAGRIGIVLELCRWLGVWMLLLLVRRVQRLLLELWKRLERGAEGKGREFQHAEEPRDVIKECREKGQTRHVCMNTVTI